MPTTSGKPAEKKKRLISDFFKVEKKSKDSKSAEIGPSMNSEETTKKEQQLTKKEARVNGKDDKMIQLKEENIEIDAKMTLKDVKYTQKVSQISERDHSTTNRENNTPKNGMENANFEPLITLNTVSKGVVTGNTTKTKENLTFDTEKWALSLSPDTRELLELEIGTLHESWLAVLHNELTKPYFLQLKRFLQGQKKASKTVFPPEKDIYSWSHYTPLSNIKCLVLGQDPYHNHNQAHGLAFSVLEPTRPPPLLVNIYKALALDFPGFQVPNATELAKKGTPGGGNLTSWAKRGVLMLNAVLTVEAHKANSHAGKGWETFTEAVIKAAIDYHRDKTGFVIMAWGSPAQKRVQKLGQLSESFYVIKSVHPLPLSAHRGFFELKVFFKCNEWLVEAGREGIDWGVINSILDEK